MSRKRDRFTWDAARACTSRRTLSAYERGRKSPSLETAARIVGAAGFDLALEPTVTFAERPAGHGRTAIVPTTPTVRSPRPCPPRAPLRDRHPGGHQRGHPSLHRRSGAHRSLGRARPALLDPIALGAARRTQGTPDEGRLIVGDKGLTDFQREVANVFFALPESGGYLLAGGAALVASELTVRRHGIWTCSPTRRSNRSRRHATRSSSPQRTADGRRPSSATRPPSAASSSTVPRTSSSTSPWTPRPPRHRRRRCSDRRSRRSNSRRASCLRSSAAPRRATSPTSMSSSSDSVRPRCSTWPRRSTRIRRARACRDADDAWALRRR
jgi:hypothetical protein